MQGSALSFSIVSGEMDFWRVARFRSAGSLGGGSERWHVMQTVGPGEAPVKAIREETSRLRVKSK